jgi:hypothetical protein
MRILFQTAPIPGSALRRPDGTLQLGSASFVVRVFDVGEKINPAYHARPLRDWRRDFGADGSLAAPIPSAVQFPIGGQPAPFAVPKALLDTLADDQYLSIEWAVEGGHG